MKTISSHVQDWLDHNPLVVNYLGQGLINHSGLARSIKADIEESIGEKVSIEAVTIALNRLGKKVALSSAKQNLSDYIGDISVQTGLSILVFEGRPLMDTVEAAHNSDYVILTEGIKHSSLIIKSSSANDLNPDPSKLVTRYDDIAGLTIQLSDGHEDTPGVIAHTLGIIAAKDIDLREVVSTYSELTIFVDKADAQAAVAALI